MPTLTPYPEAGTNIGGGSIDLDSDSLVIILLDATGTYDASHTQLSDISGSEIPPGNGYTQQTATLTSVTWTRSGVVTTLDADDVTWTASGGSLIARHAVIYSDTNDLLLCHVDFDAEQTATDGTPFTIRWHAAGILTLTTAAGT